MAQTKNTKKSKGLFQKIHNVVSPFRAIKSRHISNHPQGFISIINNKKPLSQPSISKTTAVEFEQPSTEREIEIVNSRKFAKSSTKKEKLSRPKAESEDDLLGENKFSDYISKVKKDRMMKTTSNVSSGGGGGETSHIRDSFNDKATNYINRMNIKVRRTTNVGDAKSFSLK